VELLLVPGLRISGQVIAPGPYPGMRDVRFPEQIQGLPELLLGCFGRHGPKLDLAGYEGGRGIVQADIGPGVVLEGEPDGLDGAVDREAGVEAPAGGAQTDGWRVVFYLDHLRDFGRGGQLFCG
jgi:hypothetical protein